MYMYSIHKMPGFKKCGTKKCIILQSPPPPISIPGPQGPQGVKGDTGNLNKCFPKLVGRPVVDNSIVAVTKGDGEATVRTALCDQWEWAAAVDGGADEQIPQIAADCCGNIYVVGWSGNTGAAPRYYNTTLGGNTNNASPDLTGRSTGGEGGAQLFVGKISPNGVWEWTASIGPVFDGAEAPSISIDSCGDAYVVGRSALNTPPRFYDALPDGNTSTTPSLTGLTINSQQTSIFVAKINPSGAWQWVAAMDRLNYDDQYGRVTTDRCGNIYVTSIGPADGNMGLAQPKVYDAQADGDTSPTPSLSGSLRSGPIFSIIIGKLKPTGKWEWVSTVFTQVLEPANVSADSCGNVYVAGVNFNISTLFYNANPTTGNSASSVSLTSLTGTSYYIFVAKLDCYGQWQWYTKVDSPGLDNNPIITTDTCGNIYLGGRHSETQSNEPIHFYDAITNKLSVTGRPSTFPVGQLFIAKLKPTGSWEWAAFIDNSNLITPTSLTTDNCCNVYVAVESVNDQPLFYKGGVDGVASPPPVQLYGKEPNNGGQGAHVNLHVGKLHPNGCWEWAVAVDTVQANSDTLVGQGSIAGNGCGGVYLAGTGSGTQTMQPHYFDAGANGNTLTEAYALSGVDSNNPQVFVAKITNDAKSAPILGIDRPDLVCGSNYRSVDLFGCVPQSNLKAGCPYYVDTSRDPEAPDGTVQTPSLTTKPCADCSCPNRFVGFASDTNTLVLDPEPIKCCKPGCCACKTVIPQAPSTPN